MQYDRMLAELFGEEDRAREMAHRLAETARTRMHGRGAQCHIHRSDQKPNSERALK